MNPEDLRFLGDLGLLADPHDPGSAAEAAGKGLWKAVNAIPSTFLSLGIWDLLVGTWSTGDLGDTCPKFLSRAGITTGSVTHPLSPELGAMIPEFHGQAGYDYQGKTTQKLKWNISSADFNFFFLFNGIKTLFCPLSSLFLANPSLFEPGYAGAEQLGCVRMGISLENRADGGILGQLWDENWIFLG